MALNSLKTTLAVAAMGCAASFGVIHEASAEQVVLWHGYRGEEKNAIEQVTESFAKAHEGIEVKTLAVPFDAYADKITAAVPRGKGPDIFIFAQDRLGGWVEADNTIESVDFYVDDATINRFIPTTMDAMTYRDTIYGLPFNFKVVTMFYNEDLMKGHKIPTTSTELVSTAKKLTNKASSQYGLAYQYNNFYFHSAVLNAFGGRVFEPGPTPVLDAEENLKSLDLVLKWYREEEILPPEPSAGLITTLFNSGKAAMVFNGPWFLGEVDPAVNFKLATLPKVTEAGGTPMKPWMTVEGVYISKQSEKQDAAFELVKHLTSAEGGKVMAVVGRQTPANIGVYDYDEVAEDPVLSSFRMQVANALPMPNLAEMTAVWSPATTAMNMIFKGTASPRDAMKKAQESVAEAVERLR